MMPVICRREVWYNDGMNVKVKLFASLRTLGPDEQVLELPDQMTIEEVVQLLRIPSTVRLLRIVNGEHRPPDYRLQDNDDLALFPPIAGG